ncbi:MAG: hypothetical protein DME26_16005, partial [Verrucomicrobia bacterium]
AAYVKGKGTPAQRDRLAAFQKKLAAVSVLDPACGSGNFLYVSLQLLLDLEKQAITYATQLGFKLAPQVSVQQLRAIEINPYAFELAQVSVQIGFPQWRRDNGFDNDRSPVLQNLDGFQNEDALLVPHFRSKAKTLKEAQAGEHKGDNALKFYTEREWPKCDVIVSNPPFLGGSKLWEELYGNRIPGQSDLCCYWFEKAREKIESAKCKRAGLLATQGIRGGANREVLKRIKETGDIFFAESSRDWILAGANVHVSMVGFDNGLETHRILDGKSASEIGPQLAEAKTTLEVKVLRSNAGMSFMGVTPSGPFVVGTQTATEWLTAPNAHGKPNSDVLRPWFNGSDITGRSMDSWVVDLSAISTEQEAALFESPFAFVRKEVLEARKNYKTGGKMFWKFERARPEMRAALLSHTRYLARSMVGKHQFYVWFSACVLPANLVIVFAHSDYYFFGILQSRFHEIWSLKQGTRLETRPRYTPTTCFETFPFPFPDDLELPPPKFAPAPPKLPSHPDLTPEKAYADAADFYSAKEEPPPYRVSERGVHAASASEPQAAVKRPEGRAPSTPDDHRAAIAASAKELNALRERWLNPPEWTETEYLEFPASVDGPWARYVECGDLSPLSPDATCRVGFGDESLKQESADKSAHSKIGLARYPRLVPKDAQCAAKLKKRTLTNLYNERPAWLDLAHKKLDAAVAAAYGWPADLSDEQILEKLLALNLERAAEEAKAAKVKKPKAQRAKHAEEML